MLSTRRVVVGMNRYARGRRVECHEQSNGLDKYEHTFNFLPELLKHVLTPNKCAGFLHYFSASVFLERLLPPLFWCHVEGTSVAVMHDSSYGISVTVWSSVYEHSCVEKNDSLGFVSLFQMPC